MPKGETQKFVLDYPRMSLKERQHLCYLVFKWVAHYAEAYYKKKSLAEVTYTLNPKWLRRKINKETGHEKLSVRSISYIIQAFLTAKNLEHYTTTTSSGGKSYHIVLNPQVIKQLKDAQYHIALEDIYDRFSTQLLCTHRSDKAEP